MNREDQCVEDKRALIRSIVQEIADFWTSIFIVDMKRGKERKIKP